MQKEEIGQIESFTLGFEDHGTFTMGVQISFRGAGQGFGFYCLDKPKFKDGQNVGREGTAYGMTFIIKMLELFDIQDISELVGQRVIAVRDEKSHGWGGQIIGLKTIPPDKERSFFPKRDLEEYLTDDN